MPPVLRLGPALASQGSQVETCELKPFHRPTPSACRTSPVLVLDPAKLRPSTPEAFTYHGGTTAVVSETSDFVEVSDGPPGSGLTTGERRAHDGSWTERFVHQRGSASGGAGQGKGKGGSTKGKGKGAGPRDFGRRMGQNRKLGQRWKETWEQEEDGTAGGLRTKVERHVQEVDDVDAGDEAEIRQEWDEDEEWFEASSGAGAAASSSGAASSSSAAPAAPAPVGDGQVLRSRRWTQSGKDRQTGRTWSRVVMRRSVQRGDEVVSESEEELLETEADGEERGSSRHRQGRSLETNEWGSHPTGNRWRSHYSLQTLSNAQGEVCGRERVQKWYNNGEEEQTEEWETLNVFESGGSSAPSSEPARLRLRRRVRSGRKDGRRFDGQETEWHERWEEQETPQGGELRVRRKKIEKWWRENACNNSWGEHRIDELNETGGSDSVEHRKWYDNGHEKQDEQWTERPDGSAEGSKEGARDGQTWGERWVRSCDGEDGSETVEKWHDDGLGRKVEQKEGKRWAGSKDVEWHKEELGQLVGQGDKWTVKVGGNATGDEWFEAWTEKQAEKSAEKRGKNAQGDEWREVWQEEFDAEGVRVRQLAEKEGTNAQGDQWYETWIEEQEKKKKALKRGKNAQGAEWQEEWGEEAGADGSGHKWTSKWAHDGQGNSWGNNWGDEWQGGGGGGKRWVESWDNKGRNEKHEHGTAGRPDH